MLLTLICQPSGSVPQHDALESNAGGGLLPSNPPFALPATKLLEQFTCTTHGAPRQKSLCDFHGTIIGWHTTRFMLDANSAPEREASLPVLTADSCSTSAVRPQDLQAGALPCSEESVLTSIEPSSSDAYVPLHAFFAGT